jgi:hypothetical protein
MTRARARAIAAQMERAISRQYDLAAEVRAEAEEGDPVALVVWEALDAESLPFPSTNVRSVVAGCFKQLPQERKVEGDA